MTQYIPPVLDPVQLRRIESVHRGFLYQHLYAVGCLLIAPAAGYDILLMERDEDIELLSTETHLYLQIKTRLQPLQHADIDEALTRFTELRTAHVEGRRSRRSRFGIVANIGPSPRLRQSIEAETWPNDVFVVWPDQRPPEEVVLPPAWPQLSHAVQWCIKHAEAIPFTRLSGEALTWKLAALMQYASTGTAPQQLHQITIAELPNLFEQLVIQLQHFPVAPVPYRPQEQEPGLASEERIRLIVGWSGAGKTAWASQVAQHFSLLCAYYDIGDTPGPALAASLTKELMAQFLGSQVDIVSRIFLPGQTGLDSLRALDLIFAEQQLPVTVVVDNIHLLEPDDVRRVIQASPNIHYVLLAQPLAAQAELEASIGIQAEMLRGWSMDTVAEVFAAAGAHVDPLVATQILRLTGGLPLYVTNAAYLTQEYYRGNAIAFCEDVQQQTHVTRTQQEVILDRVMATLPATFRDVAAMLSLVDIPLTPDEARTFLIESLGLAPGVVARALRNLTGLSVCRQLHDRRIMLHDVFRLVAVEHRASMDQSIIHRARLSLKQLLIQAKAPSHQVQRLSLLLRLLYETGEVETLVDLSSDEYLHELGLARELRANIEAASNSLDLPPHSRFWALDTLAFWDIQEDSLQPLNERLTQMAKLLPETRNGRREQVTLLMKQMLLSGKQGDIVKARSIYAALLRRIGEDTQLRRIVRYNFAVMLLRNELHAEAEQEAFALTMEYYEALGLDLQTDVIAQNPPAIAAKLADTPTQQDDLKHLADSLDILARAVNAQGRRSGLSRIHSLKFYDMANAPRSLIRVAQDYIDEILRDFHDPNAARLFIEQSLLPLTQKYGLLDYLVPIRAQYAVVLAYCGESRAALTEIERLAVFVKALSEEQRAELANQYRLIEGIIQGYIQLGVNNPSRVRYLNPQHLIRRSPKISRNAPCPCGSGRKYKRCHGQ